MNLLFILKDYCLNSSLAGLSYIADARFHYTERIFWLSCIAFSTYGSYYLIRESLDDFDESSISMVTESLQPDDQTYFPSVGICEIGHTKEIYDRLEHIVNSLRSSEEEQYNYDVEDFLLRIIFHNLYNFGSFVSYCLPYKESVDQTKCPESNYRSYAEMVRLNCSDLILNCDWNSSPFECCKYFRPIQTTVGKCFLLNSIQIVEKKGPNWLQMRAGEQSSLDMLQVELTKAVSIFIINEEDIPHMLLTTLQFNQQHDSTIQEILLNVQNVVNDDGVRDIDRELRKCIFPDELIFDSAYKFYSYSTCVTECLKQAQLKQCNCTHFNMIYDENDKTVQCNYDGMACLDRTDLVYPRTTIMQPWRTNGLVCNCVPSCTEHEIKLVGRTYTNIPKSAAVDKNRITKIVLESLPSQRYRRQAVRNNLDIVVSVGGIMGLFLGASILSVVEFVYFFSVRLFGTALSVRRTRKIDSDSTQPMK